MEERPFNSDVYAQLLAAARPVVIETEEDHDRMLQTAEELMEKGEALGLEEEKLLTLVVFLIEAFERGIEEEEEEGDEDEEAVVEPPPPPKPHETLRRLIEARGLELHDVADIFGSPGAAQEVLEGRREMTRGQGKQLSKFFGVPAKLFTA